MILFINLESEITSRATGQTMLHKRNGVHHIQYLVEQEGMLRKMQMQV